MIVFKVSYFIYKKITQATLRPRTKEVGYIFLWLLAFVLSGLKRYVMSAEYVYTYRTEAVQNMLYVHKELYIRLDAISSSAECIGGATDWMHDGYNWLPKLHNLVHSSTSMYSYDIGVDKIFITFNNVTCLYHMYYILSYDWQQHVF